MFLHYVNSQEEITTCSYTHNFDKLYIPLYLIVIYDISDLILYNDYNYRLYVTNAFLQGKLLLIIQ